MFVLFLGIAVIGFKTYQSTQIQNDDEIDDQLPLPPSESGLFIGQNKSVRLGSLPDDAALVYHQNEFAFVMDKNGARETQITFDTPRSWEHLAISPDRRFMVGNEHPKKELSRSLLWLYDLKNKTEAQLAPDVYFAGDGGVDWDPAGFVYFKCKKEKQIRFSDICKVKYDGSILTQLTNTPLVEETDVAVSEDGSLVTYALLVPEPKNNSAHTEIWVMNADGTEARMVYKTGTVLKKSGHDPEISPDNTRVIFSMVNSEVAPNFPNIPAANTAHDIWTVNLDGGDPIRLTKPGPISMIPDWQDDAVVYTDVSESYKGASIVNASDKEQSPRRIKSGANSARWIPR